MADEIKQPVMDEYKISDDVGHMPEYETTPASEGTASQPGAAKFDIKKINWKRIGVPIGILVGIFIVYNVIGFFSGNKNKRDTEADLAALQQQQAKPIQTMPQVQTITPQPAMTSAVTDQLNQLQASIGQKIDAYSAQASSNRDQIASVNDAVVKTQQDVAVVNNNIVQLANAIQAMEAQLQKLTAPKVKVKKKVVAPPIAYHVRAIVPGRVWLESADGKGVTLKVGDSLEGYGTVQVISPRQGMVVMSNGAIIQYGVNDF